MSNLKDIINTIECQTSKGEEIMLRLSKNEGEVLKYIIKSFLANSDNKYIHMHHINSAYEHKQI